MELRHINNLRRFADEVRISVEQTQPPPVSNQKTMNALEAFGRERLSTHYFMRDFLYSEIAAVHGIPNVPDDPELAIEAGKGLCENLLEPIRRIFGHITIRSAFRSTTVNGYGNKHKLNCAGNERNFAGHIWDHRDKDGIMGATACIVVPWFLEHPGYCESKDWRPLAWFIHDKLPYSEMEFYPGNAAFNLTWREKEPRRVYVDGPPHDAPDQVREDEARTRALIEFGYIVIRLHHGADWPVVLRPHPDLFGALNERSMLGILARQAGLHGPIHPPNPHRR